MTEGITPLKKVFLSVKDLSANSEEQALSFIYGVASTGLCPFECEIAGRRVNEPFQTELSSGESGEYFGHLLPLLRKVLAWQTQPETLSLEWTIKGVEQPEEREVVTAIKDALGGNCGGSCDCGCH